MTDTNVVRAEGGMLLTPDPSAMTREAIDRDIVALNNTRHAELAASVAPINARLDAMDEAVRIFKADLTRVPTETDKAVGNLRDLMIQMFSTTDEKFATIYERFRGVDAQFSQRDIAVAAALQAQKEAAGTQTDFFTTTGEKSEAAVAKQIDALLLTLTNATGTLDGKLQDLKERLTRMEGTNINSASNDAGLHAAVTSMQNDIRELREARSVSQGVGAGRTVAVVEQRAEAQDTRATAGEMRAYIALGVSLIIAAITILGFAMRFR